MQTFLFLYSIAFFPMRLTCPNEIFILEFTRAPGYILQVQWYVYFCLSEWYFYFALGRSWTRPVCSVKVSFCVFLSDCVCVCGHSSLDTGSVSWISYTASAVIVYTCYNHHCCNSITYPAKRRRIYWFAFIYCCAMSNGLLFLCSSDGTFRKLNQAIG